MSCFWDKTRQATVENFIFYYAKKYYTKSF